MSQLQDDRARAARTPAATLDAIIVGAGFSGMYLLHRLRALGLTSRVIEAASDVGGTWFWNRYPGARCDIESLDYSYSFSEDLEQDWHWPDRYAVQPDILRYINHVADRFDLRRDVRFGTRVTRAAFDDATRRWSVETDRGERFTATYVIMATGCLSVPRVPDFDGRESFVGKLYHTANWPHGGVDFTGQRVGVVGTGSSGIQSIPIIARQAASLTVFQRTPNFSIPAWNGPIAPAVEQRVKDNYATIRDTLRWSFGGYTNEVNEAPSTAMSSDAIEDELERRWRIGGFSIYSAYGDLMTDQRANEIAAEFVRDKIRSIVKDPAVAELLCPKDHPFGTKRLCVDTDYYETFNRDTVTLVDIRETPIVAITPDGLRTTAAAYDLDAIVLATGFDAMTGALLAVDIRGRGGRTLRDKWAQGPRSYLGLMVAGFPNLFTVTGPGSPSVLSNMLTSIEQHVEWIADCIGSLRDRQLRVIEPTIAAEDAWVAHCDETAGQTLYPQANSWYMGANIPGKPRVFMPYVAGVGAYRKICDEIVAKGYEGFAIGG